MLSIFDDGSSATTDATGAVTSVTDSSGADVPVSSETSGIGQQFANLVTFGVGSLINAKVNAPPVKPGVPAAAPVMASPTIAGLASSPLLKMALLGGGAFLLYKKFF